MEETEGRRGFDIPVWIVMRPGSGWVICGLLELLDLSCYFCSDTPCRMIDSMDLFDNQVIKILDG